MTCDRHRFLVRNEVLQACGRCLGYLLSYLLNHYCLVRLVRL